MSSLPMLLLTSTLRYVTPPTHHCHDPNSFWNTDVSNAKSQSVNVNPFDVSHEVDEDCGDGAMFVLAKAMENPAWLKKGRK